MAKKRGAQPATAIVEKTTISETPPLGNHHDSDAVVENLKALNGRLVKEAMSSRVEVNQLLSTLEHSAASEVERAVCHVVLAESFKEEAATVAEKSEEIEKHIKEKTETVSCLDKLRMEFDKMKSEKASVEIDLGLACKERDESRIELGQFQIAAMKEINSLKVDLNALVMEKTENVKCLEGLRMDFERLMSEKASVEKYYEVACKERDASREEFHRLRENSEEEIRSMKTLLEVLYKEKEGMIQCLNNLKEEFARTLKEKEIVEKDLSVALSARDSIRGEFEVNERKFEALANQNTMVLDELEKKVSEVDFKNGEVQRIRDELRIAIRSSEDFSRDACEAQNRFQSLTEKLKDEISLLKKIGSEKDAKIASLDEKNGEHLEEICRLNATVDLKTNEHRSLKISTAEQIAELNAKLKMIGSEKDAKIASLDGKNKEHMEEISRLNATVDLKMDEHRSFKISTAGQIAELNAKLKRIGSEKDALDAKNEKNLEEINRLNATVDLKMNEHRSLKISTTEQIAELNAKLQKSEKSLKFAADGKALLMSNITQLEYQIGLLKKEEKSKASVISDLEKDISRLNEELEAKAKYCVDMAEQQKQKEKQMEESKIVLEKQLEDVKACANVLSENTLSALQETVMLVVNSSDRQKTTIKELPKSVELTDDSIKSFLAGFVSVNKVISSKTKEMESVKQELVLLKKKSLWAWMSSAATVFAAVAFILKSR